MEYLCARLWGMCPRLLARRDLEGLLTLNRLRELIDALLNTEYQHSLMAGTLEMEDLTGVEACLRDTFRHRQDAVLRLIRQCAPGHESLLGGEWDLHHVKALARGILRGAGAEAIEASFVDAGTWTREQFRDAAQAADLAELAARLGTWHSGWEEGLARWKNGDTAEAPGLREVELALEEVHARNLFARASRSRHREERKALETMASLFVDLANGRTAVRLLGRHVPREEVHRLYLAGGRFSLREFETMLGETDVDQLYNTVGRGPVADALGKGVLYYVNVKRSSVFERFFDEQWMVVVRRLARRDLVSIAVPVYYLLRIRNELTNLCLIARGIRYDLPSATIQEKLVYV
jgi:vacuolar-type H+-ATPase subunit C/Vma6